METNNLTKHHPLLSPNLTGYFRVGVLGWDVINILLIYIFTVTPCLGGSRDGLNELLKYLFVSSSLLKIEKDQGLN